MAVVQLPVDLGWQKIEKDSWFDASQAYIQPEFAEPKQEALDHAMQILQKLNAQLFSLVSGCVGQGVSLWRFQEKLKPL